MQDRDAVMPHTPNAITDPSEPAIYRIRVKGHLGPRWERWFSPMVIAPQANGDTLLTGFVVDQAALHGVLRRIRDLGLPLISIERIESDTPVSRNERSTT
jgi:hypothetical protein